jgi:lysophospholipase L1-like esterase
MRMLVVASVAVLLLVAELLARSAGLHTPVLYERTAYGYRVSPNQSLKRFGRAVAYNSQGLRSGPLSGAPDPGELRVLCLGDSITNGGTLTDQADTYPNRLEGELSSDFAAVRVLNASAGGWALGNEFGWLRENGTFEASVVVLEIATHDLFQPPAASDLVGRHPSFPDRAPRFALSELLFRYLLPWIGIGLPRVDPGAAGLAQTEAAMERALAALEALVRESRARGAVAVVLFVEQPAPLEHQDPLTREAKMRMRELLRRERVTLVEAAPLVEREGGPALFRDGLHPNAAGNAVLAKAVAPAVEGALRRAPAQARSESRGAVSSLN